ncbi:Trm112 family protein [Mesorhizobium sp. CA14]|uniref:Trm112 family protein n=1 Tax=Mesorhizobium sp. CA14 TaxID=2876642 RepID=UPI001CD0313D|nr:Trm112 family protein [Mesorhizobium sp. CA14]MBZ9849995.1 Trm112 family protein [Mesorhizobium sp. CA14]
MRTLSFDPVLLDWLVCPMTGGSLAWDSDHDELLSTTAGLAYPIRDGIPVMLASEARTIDAVMRRSSKVPNRVFQT